MFIFIPKIEFIIHFFFGILNIKILQFNWLAAFWFISRDILEKFFRYGIGSDISITKLVFFYYFEEKLMTSFKKTNKKNCFGIILELFVRILENMNFPGRDDQSVFKYSNYLPSCRNEKKKLTSHSWEKS